MSRNIRTAQSIYKQYLQTLNEKLGEASLPIFDPKAVDRALAGFKSKANTLANLLRGKSTDEEDAIRELQVRCQYYEHLIDDILLPDATAHFNATKSSAANAQIEAAAEKLATQRVRKHAQTMARASVDRRKSVQQVRRDYVMAWCDKHRNVPESNRAELICRELKQREFRQETYFDADRRLPKLRISAPSVRTIRSDIVALVGKRAGR